MRLWKRCVLFCVGGTAYLGLELLWRGWTHGSMFAAGGLCFLLIGHLTELARPGSLMVQTLLGAGVITMVELAAGLVVNRGYQVWDYRGLPLNFLGQICLPFCLLWIPVSLGANLCYRLVSGALEKRSGQSSR